MEYQYGSLEERFCEQNSDYGRGIFISISGALVGNVLSPCGEKANNIPKFLRHAPGSLASARPTRAFALGKPLIRAGDRDLYFP